MEQDRGEEEVDEWVEVLQRGRVANASVRNADIQCHTKGAYHVINNPVRNAVQG